MAKVLIVDDEPQVAKALGRLLRREGFEVAQAQAGAEALELVDAFQPDAVISDFRMPGMNGAELLAAVRQRLPLALRIVLSGFADRRSVSSAINEGEICRFLSKPWDDEALVLLLRQLLVERELLASLYQPFRTPVRGVSCEAVQHEAKLVIKPVSGAETARRP